MLTLYLSNQSQLRRSVAWLGMELTRLFVITCLLLPTLATTEPDAHIQSQLEELDNKGEYLLYRPRRQVEETEEEEEPFSGSGNGNTEVNETCSFNADCVDNAKCINGLCACNDGYTDSNQAETGGICLAEVGTECTLTGDCVPNAVCTDIDMTLTCQCSTGFQDSTPSTSGGICVACRDNTYGEACARNCNCNTTNSVNPEQSCNHVTGICACNDFWTGTTCDEDVDECATKDSCPETKPNSQCQNTDGSFQCTCLDGYTETDGNCVLGVACVPGFSYSNEQAACVQCPINQYQDLVGQTSCKICPNSQRTARPGSTNVDDCFAYESTDGHSLAPKGDDSAVVKIYVGDVEIPFGDQLYQTIYINVNGLVAFGSDYQSFFPEDVRSNSIDAIQFLRRSVIAPFYTDMITEFDSAGSVTYSYVVDPDASDARVTRSLQVLETNLGLTGFDVTHLLIVTWQNIRRFGSNKRATFQMVLVSDSHRSYVNFYYVDIDFEFDTVFVGFVSGNPTFYAQHVTSFTNRVLQLPTSANAKGMFGAISYALNEGPLVNYGRICIQLFNKYLPVRQKTNFPARRCPCDLFRALRDFFFTALTFQVRNGRRLACLQSIPTWGNVAAMECCYSRQTFGYVSVQPLAGGLFLYHPLLTALHEEADVLMRHYCCDLAPHLCISRYYGLHADTRPCIRFSPFIRRWFWGDPHIETLDGQTYTFNGHGEYRLLDINVTLDQNYIFKLQARTERAVQANGNTSDATIFSAFVAEDDTGASVEVRLNGTKDGLVLYGNRIDQTNMFNERDDFSVTSDNNNLRLQKDNTSGQLTAVFTKSRIAVTVGVAEGMLSVAPSIPDEFKNQTGFKGMLGNFDGDSTNDFVYPNGTLLPNDVRDREIYFWGREWQITVSTSLFDYDEGTNSSTYSDYGFIPFFLDEANATERAEAETQCGSPNATECIYDYLATKNRQLALNTKKIETDAVAAESQARNLAPELTADATFNVSIGERISFNLVGTDDDRFTYSFVENTQNVSSLTDNGDGTASVSLVLSSDTPVGVSVTATDSFNVSAEAVEVNIRLCTGCNSHGSCDFTQAREDNRSTTTFTYAICNCLPAWSGPDCKDDTNGCDGDPCSIGRNCTDVLAAEHNSTSMAFTCTDCPPGYTDDGTKCDDIDECSSGNSGCSHNCTNNDGSFTCFCPSGYRLISQTQCQEIDECEEGTSDCTQVCTNEPLGSFTCSCLPGFIYDPVNNNCTKNVTDVCEGAAIDCTAADGCTLAEDGNATCFCNAGYQLTADNACQNIDECGQQVCIQKCNDTDGSYLCFCENGYQLDVDKTSCKLCESPAFGENCAETCAETENVLECDPFKGAICRAGFTGLTCENDVDECTVSPNICGDINRNCINNVGSYSCQCRDGYEEDDGGTCTDINECLLPSLNTCEQICDNVAGGFTCSCNDGYVVNSTDINKCADVNECETVQSGCNHRCENKMGSFNCRCVAGYQLGPDRKTCVKVEDLCAAFGLSCTQMCVVEDNVAWCQCGPGYKLAVDNQTCIDINECEDASLNLCSEKDSCLNNDGGFTCSCAAGFKLDQDDRTCLECDAFHFGTNCADECGCGAGSMSCDRVTGCVCTDGWIGTKCDSDRDECTVRNNCTGVSNTICQNTPGSYQCVCDVGFQKNSSGDCVDTDECISPLLHTCDQACTNTEGSYTCSCSDGFIQDGNSCNDIDECAGVNECDHTCVNAIGNYRCTCDEGFDLDITDRRSCLVKTSCEAVDETACSDANATCAVVSGKPECRCIKGYIRTNTSDDKSCQDVNECDLDLCSDLCTNELGSFVCSCNKGSKLDPADNITCTACTEGRYGTDCVETCLCDADNTASCNKVNGSCTCKLGWEDTNCTTNIDECTVTPTICDSVPNSECIDLPGSYDCSCLIGYAKTGDNTCQACDVTHWGISCNVTCSCIQTNTGTCNSVNGTCTCKSGWQGTDCSEDIDECEDASRCPAAENKICVNTNGSFRCDCVNGYSINDQNTCIDFNECLEGTHNCTYACQNVPGSFECTCAARGYTGSGNNCTVCTGNSFGPMCSEICACNTGTSIDPQQTCDIDTGVCKCQTGWTGDCTEDLDECADPATFSCDVNANCSNKPSGQGYECICKVGYQNVSGTCQACSGNTYADNCTSVCNCNTEQSVDPAQTCDHITGVCICKPGLTGDCLQDLDECNDTSTFSCPEHSQCRNLLDGLGYVCDCNVGYNKSADGSSCDVCTDNTFGMNCNGTCNCNASNSLDANQACNYVTGVCECNSQWKGDTCDEDIDECTDNTFSCPVNSTCRNTPGGYLCDCDIGFSKSQDGSSCNACSGNTFGNGCASSCTCNATNAETPAQSCNHVTGVCACNEFWTGGNCTLDVNECEAGTDNCTQSKNNSGCHNTVGSFECSCRLGYVESNGTCVTDTATTTLVPTQVNQRRVLMSITLSFTAVDGVDITVGLTNDRYKALAQTALTAFYSNELDSNFALVVIEVREGSLIVVYAVVINDLADDVVDLAQANNKLVRQSSTIDLDGTQVTALALQVEGSDITVGDEAAADTQLCQSFTAILPCDDKYECRVTDSVPSCRPIPTEDNFDLIVGLAVGIPLCFIAGLILALVVYYIKRRKQVQITKDFYTWERQSASHGFSPMVAPKMMSFGRSGGFYGPQMWDDAETSSSSSGDYHRKRGRRDDFEPSGPLYSNNNRGSGGFSWDFLYNYIAPHERYEIRRPQHESTANPVYSTRKDA